MGPNSGKRITESSSSSSSESMTFFRLTAFFLLAAVWGQKKKDRERREQNDKKDKNANDINSRTTVKIKRTFVPGLVTLAFVLVAFAFGLALAFVTLFFFAACCRIISREINELTCKPFVFATISLSGSSLLREKVEK